MIWAYWLNANLKWLLVLSMLGLAACSATSKLPAEMPSIPKPAPIHTKPVTFGVTDGLVYFKTMRDYESMAVNMADILRYIKDTQIYMENCK